MLGPASAIHYRQFNALSMIDMNFTTYFGLIINFLPYSPDSFNITGKTTFIGREESSLRITIQCGTYYAPDTHWLFMNKSGILQELTPLSDTRLRIRNSGNKHYLSILNAKLEDDGLYTCIFMKSNTYTDQSTRVHIKSIAKPKSWWKWIGGLLNEEVTLSCFLPKNSSHTLGWRRNEKNLESSEKYEISQRDGIYFLKILKLTYDDAGRYYCYMKYNYNVQQMVVLRLGTFFGSHKIEEFVIVSTGETIQIRCDVRKNMVTQFIRLVKYVYSEKIEQSVEGTYNGSVFFSIQNATSEDEGIFSCKLISSIQNETIYRYLIVKEKPKLFRMPESEKYIFAFEHSNIELDCSIQPYLDEKQPKWYKVQGKRNNSNQEIFYGMHSGIRLLSYFRNLVLSIQRANRDHAGIYKCSLGEEFFEYHVFIREIRKIEGINYKTLIDFFANQNFECYHGVNQYINITWLHNGTKIEARQEKYTIIEENHISLLVLHDAVPSDSGVYSCCYDINHDNCSQRELYDWSLRKDMRTKVIQIRAMYPQKIGLVMSFSDDEKAVLPCAIDQLEQNEKLMWILPNNSTFECSSGTYTNGNYTIYSQRSRCSLEIVRLVDENYFLAESIIGVFRCILKPNNVLIASIYLNILRLPKFSHAYLNLTAYLNYNFAITGLILNPDDSKVDLEKTSNNGFDRIFSHHLRKGNFSRLSYNIPNVRREDEGEYTFVLYPYRSYSMLNDRMKIYVTVKAPPVIKTNDIKAYAGQDVNLTCEVENYEEFKIMWERVENEEHAMSYYTQIENSSTSNKQILSLCFSNVDKIAEGFYQCQAMGNHAIFSESILFSVLEPSIELSDTIVNDGEDAVITCRVENLGIHEARLYLKDGDVDFRHDPRYLVSRITNGGSMALSWYLQPAQKNDEGLFTCWVFGHINLKKSAYLTVI